MTESNSVEETSSQTEQQASGAINSVSDLWNETIDIWHHGFMGVDINKLVIAIAIFSAFLLIRGLFTKYVINYMLKLSKNTENNLDDKIIVALAPPIKFIPLILGLFFASQYSGLNHVLGSGFNQIMRTLIAFTIFWGIYRTLYPISHMSDKLDKMLSPMMAMWLFKVLRVVVVFIGAAVILEVWGIQVGPLLAGLGIFGAAVALGAQDMFKNMIAGMTIIMEKKFQPGDWIKVSGVVEGTVEDIGFRSTEVRQFDKAPVQVPNALLSDAALTNFSRMSHRRIKWIIGVEYKTTKDQLKIIRDEITSYIHNNDDFDKSVSTFVHINNFNASSIDFLVYCFTKTTNWGEWLQIKEELAYKIKEIVEQTAGTGFAFPSQSVYVESLPSELPEVFDPPKAPKAKKNTQKSKKSA